MANIPQRSFAAGEITPTLYARTDLAKYAVGLRTCRNTVVLPQGGVTFRPGTTFCAEAEDSSKPVRLMPFEFSSTDSVMLVFGDKTLRFIQNGALFVTNSLPPAIYQLTTPYAAADLADLNFTQAGDIVTIVSPKYEPYELKRLSAASWTLSAIVFTPTILCPANIVNGGLGSLVQWFVVTSVSASGEESLPSAVFEGGAGLDVTWDAADGADHYNVYRSVSGSAGPFGFQDSLTGLHYLFSATSTAIPDYTLAPHFDRTLFASAGNYPSVVAYYQQRLVFANSTNAPQTVWMSRTGDFHNFRVASPALDDDAVTFTLVGDEVQAIRHLLALGKLIIGSDGGEWLIDGDQSGIITPTQVNPRTGSYNGSAPIKPIKVDNTILYVQSLGNKVLELKTNIVYGYYTFQGADLTLLSAHLFKKKSIVSWAYQQIPGYISWAVRNDGVLLGLTYVQDQQVAAWHRHDTDGLFEDVAVIPENGEHAVYVVVRRPIGGIYHRYIERFVSLTLVDVANDACFMDSVLEYDGRNAGATLGLNMELTGGTNWTYDETLTLTAIGAKYFAPSMVGDAIFLHGTDGTEIRFLINAWIDAFTVTGHVQKTVPVSMQGVVIAVWDHAVPAVGGLGHLEGKNVSVYADGFVVGSPNNSEIDLIAVSFGTVTLDQPYAHIRVGLPYIGDAETLDIDTPQGASLKEEKIAVTRVGAFVESTLGLFAGAAAPTGTDPLEGLNEFLERREDLDNPDVPPAPVTDYIFTNTKSQWGTNGRIFLRQVDPVPFTLLAVIPQGYIPGASN